MELSGRTAVITGGANGIGRAVALRLLRRAARVALWDLDEKALERACRELSKEGTIRGYRVDVTDRAQVADAARRTESELGPVDLLDNNAGVYMGGDFLSCSDQSLERTMAVNVNAAMWCTRAFLPGMVERGRGAVVMMASASGLLGVPGMAAYAASKHAVIGLSESIRLELKKKGCSGVVLTLVCPGFVNSGMFAGVAPPRLMPWLAPEDVAAAVERAVLRGRTYAALPFIVRLVPLLKGLLSRGAVDRVGGLLRLDRALDGWTGR